MLSIESEVGAAVFIESSIKLELNKMKYKLNWIKYNYLNMLSTNFYPIDFLEINKKKRLDLQSTTKNIN